MERIIIILISFVLLINAQESSLSSSNMTISFLSVNNTTPLLPYLCRNNSCPTKRYCVPDSQAANGYKCCRTKNCEKSLLCFDREEFTNGYKVPNRQPPKFRPDERIFYYCNENYKSSTIYSAITCMSNGSWNLPPPRCLPYSVGKPFQNISSQVEDTTIISINPAPNNHHNAIDIIIGMICLLLLVLAISCWFLYKRYKNPNSNYIRASRHSSLGIANSSSLLSMKLPNLSEGSTRACDFMQFVALGHNNNDQRFREEFEDIQNWQGPQPTWEASKLHENKEKNRYTNIVAYDHSRVRLSSSDYINANYVSSYHKTKAYIACQGPLPSTFNDFWKMIWENDTATIVMITNLVEKGRRKCDQYWPQEGKEQYKHITVTLKSTESFANYTIRTFSIKNTKSRRNARGGERRVVQYHFTQWPDHGTPEYPLPVLTFIRRSVVSNPVHAGPIVVHCSAGVGRSGTYIVIHSMMQMLQATGSLNINGFLRHIRLQRNHLVQTEDQYVFVHDALLEYIVSGVTELTLNQLPNYYNYLTASAKNANDSKQNQSKSSQSDQNVSNRGSGDDLGQPLLLSELEKQFLKVVYVRGDNRDYDFALRSVNSRKNRPGAVLPIYRSRVSLCNRTGAEGSDYINASFVQGYRSSYEFIITQLPLSHTRDDFWQLVWDYNCSTVVTIKDKEWNADTDTYWPKDGALLHYSAFNVTSSSEEGNFCQGNDCDIRTREFILEATKDDYVLVVKQFELSNWNTREPNLDQLEAVSVIGKFTAGKDGSTVVQDRFGSTSAAQFVCWHLMQRQLSNENIIDVYQAAAITCQMRPKVFTSPVHLKFLYEAMLLEGRNSNNPSKVREKPQQVFGNLEALNSKTQEVDQMSNGIKMTELSSESSDNACDASEVEQLVDPH